MTMLYFFKIYPNKPLSERKHGIGLLDTKTFEPYLSNIPSILLRFTAALVAYFKGLGD